jgi:hypothetical protein
MVEIRFHDDPQEFLSIAEQLLRRRPAENSPLLGFAARWARFPAKAENGLLYSIWEDGVMSGAAGITYRWRTVLCTDLPDDAPTVLLVDLLARSILPRGVVAPRDTAFRLGNAWRALTGKDARLRFELGCYTLDQLPVWPLPTRAGGAMRLV